MRIRTILRRLSCLMTVAIVSSLSAPRVDAHFLWILMEPDETGKAPSMMKAHVFLSETPVPEGPELLRFVEGVSLKTGHGACVPLKTGEESLEANWLGSPPAMLDTQREMGTKSREGRAFRLSYTARMQSGPAAADAGESLDGLRVRLADSPEAATLLVTFDKKPVDKARVKVFPHSGEPFETMTDASGRVPFAQPSQAEALATGNIAVFANWVDTTPGGSGEKAFDETRHYATWTYMPKSMAGAEGQAQVSTHFGMMPEPAVNSFGGAVLGDWLYVYSGHVGQTHKYDNQTTTRTFRRFNLKDRTTWENLPVERDLQGVALVSDGRYLYRTGGMYASNPRGEKAILNSVTDFERFDPQTKGWTIMTNLPEPRSTHDSYLIGRSLYVVGGWKLTGSTDESDFHTEMLIFDLDHPEKGWKAVDQPFERRALSIAEYGGKLYVLGGLTSDSQVSLDVDVYDPATGAWAKGPSLPSGSKAEGFGTTAFTVNGRLYYNGVTGPVYRLSKDAARWDAVAQWHLPRITHRILPGISDDLIAVGGNVGRIQTPVIESLPVGSIVD